MKWVPEAFRCDKDVGPMIRQRKREERTKDENKKRGPENPEWVALSPEVHVDGDCFCHTARITTQ